MLTFILNQKWIILCCLEILAWITTFLMLYARYKIKSPLWFKISFILFFITGIFPQTILGILNFITVGKIDTFTIILLLLLLYSTTLGRTQILRLDVWAKNRFSAK